MLVLAIAAGILLGVAGSAIAAMSGAWHRRRARRLLTASGCGGPRKDLVVEPVDETLHQARQAASDLALAHGE